MSRSHRKQPVWKDHNSGAKRTANRRVRRILSNPEIVLDHGKYKRVFCSYDIFDYCSIVPRDFREYYRRSQLQYGNASQGWECAYKDWIKYRRK